MPDSILWLILGALAGWLGKLQLERFKVTEVYRTEQAKRRVDAQVEVWKHLDLSLYYTSFYLQSIATFEIGDEASRVRLNARADKAKEVHDKFEIALQERRMILGDEYKRLIGIHNRLAELDQIVMRRPVDTAKLRKEIEQIEQERADLASIVKKSLRW